MVNYKPNQADFISMGGIQRTITSDEKIKVLYLHYNLASTPDTLEDISTATIYQVPTGKKFKAFGLIAQWNAIAGVHTVYSGDTENTQTTLTFTLQHPAINETREYPIDLEFLADKYIVWDSSAANTNYFIFILGMEIDA